MISVTFVSVISAMIRGAVDGDKFTVQDYQVEKTPQIFSQFIAHL